MCGREKEALEVSRTSMNVANMTAEAINRASVGLPILGSRTVV
jgi:hypothetical protein